ncbi:MAG: hypothetical protein QW514_06645 [Thermoprotei archaeon]
MPSVNFAGEGYNVVVDYVPHLHEAEFIRECLRHLEVKVKHVVLMAQ